MTIIGVTGELCLQRASDRIERALLASDSLLFPTGNNYELMRHSVNQVRAEVEVAVHHGSMERSYQYELDEHSFVLRKHGDDFFRLAAQGIVGRTVACQRLFLPPIGRNFSQILIPKVFLDVTPDYAVAIDFSSYHKISVDHFPSDQNTVSCAEFADLPLYQCEMPCIIMQ